MHEPLTRRAGPSRWRKLLIISGSLLLTLASLELGLRAVGSMMAVARHGGDGDPQSGRRPFRILCVGDSWTQGAAYGTYPELLVQRLRRSRPHERIDYVNIGLAGTNSSQALQALPRAIGAHRPDLLLVLTGNNDHHNLTDSAYWQFHDERLDGLSLLAARTRVAAHSFRLFRLARTAWQVLAGGATANEFFDARQAGSDHSGLIAIDRETHRKQLEYNLTRLIELAQREQVPVVFQTYFHFHGYRVNEIVRDVASRHGVPLVDHNLMFHTNIPAESREIYRIADGHPNADGYALMAANIEATLTRAALLPAF
jgi:lysophospholipase L1-like esterase